MKAGKKRLIACAAIAFLAAASTTATGLELGKPETAVRLVEGRMFLAPKNKNRFRFPKKVKPSSRNTRRR